MEFKEHKEITQLKKNILLLEQLIAYQEEITDSWVAGTVKMVNPYEVNGINSKSKFNRYSFKWWSPL